MKNEETIEALNALITINNDRIEGYSTASKETKELDLKIVFAQFMATSQKCKQELVAEVNALGGQETEGTTTSGKFFRVWMDLKAAITGKDRKTILNSCEFGEDAAIETYDHAIANESEHLNTEQLSMIVAQKSLIKGDHEHIKILRNAVVDA